MNQTIQEITIKYVSIQTFSHSIIVKGLILHGFSAVETWLRDKV